MRISDWSSDVCSSDLHLIIQIDRHHGVGADGRGVADHVLESVLLGAAQRFFIAAGAPADDVAQPREDVAKHVGADDGVARDDAQVFDALAALDSIGGEDPHRILSQSSLGTPAYTA